MDITNPMGIGCRCRRIPLNVHGHEKVMLFPLWKRHSVFQVPQNYSNPNHAQSDKHQLFVMLFIAQGIKVAHYWFSRQRQKLMAKYLKILSHCIIQFCEFGFHFPFQPELLTDEINPTLSFLCPFYLHLLEVL